MKTIISFLFYLLLLLVAALSLQRCFLWEPERLDAPCPTITGFSPSGAPFGGIVTVTGSNFVARSPDFHTVKIGETIVPVDSITEVSENGDTLRFKVPKGAGNGRISITLKTATECPAVSDVVFAYYYTATMVEKLAGTPMNNNCTSPTQDCLNQPVGIDVDNDGNVIVADKFNHVVRKITPSGNISVTYGHAHFKVPGCDSLPVNNSENTSFRTPVDIEVDAAGDIYVAEENNNIIRVMKKSGSSEVFAGKCQTPTQDFSDGVCSATLLSVPYSLSKEGDNLYFIDNGRVRKATLNGLNCSNISTLLVNNASTEYFRALEFSEARTGQGPIFIVDEKAKNIKSLSNTGNVSVISPASSELSLPVALTVDSRGNIFIADKTNHKIYVLYTDGKLVVIAGTGVPGYTANGPGITAQFNEPSGLALDETREILYIADKLNHVIRKMSFQ